MTEHRLVTVPPASPCMGGSRHEPPPTGPGSEPLPRGSGPHPEALFPGVHGPRLSSFFWLLVALSWGPPSHGLWGLSPPPSSRGRPGPAPPHPWPRPASLTLHSALCRRCPGGTLHTAATPPSTGARLRPCVSWKEGDPAPNARSKSHTGDRPLWGRPGTHSGWHGEGALCSSGPRGLGVTRGAAHSPATSENQGSLERGHAPRRGSGARALRARCALRPRLGKGGPVCTARTPSGAPNRHTQDGAQALAP